MKGDEILECCICGRMEKRHAMPKHLMVEHGWEDVHALGYVIPPHLRSTSKERKS